MNTPYTYLLGWSDKKLYYYGVRYSKNCHPGELLINYFSSSKVVKKMINENCLPDIVQIRKTFDTSEKARFWESKVLRRLNVINDKKWINKTNNISIRPQPKEQNPMYGRSGASHPLFGKSPSEETRRKIGEKSKLKKGNMPQGFSDRMREINTGRKHTKQTKEKISKSLKGRVFSEDHKIKISKNHANVSGVLNPAYGRVWVTNNHERKLIPKKEAEKYLCNGWKLGKKIKIN